MLQQIPELKWAGVRLNGCRAVISVRERTEPDKESVRPGTVSLVAAEDGVITEVTVLRGQGLCHPGQAVQKGELLVSAYTSGSKILLADRAEGEIFARTNRTFTMKTPEKTFIKCQYGHRKTRFGLRIGKKCINFYKDSGIPGAFCDRMYTESVWTLPGGFQLPVAWTKEQIAEYRIYEIPVCREETEKLLKHETETYLMSRMIAGKILSCRETVSGGCLRGSYSCEEMIGREYYEEIVRGNGENSGTDH